MATPAFKGGQGRSSRSVRDDGTGLALTWLALVSIAAAIVLGAWGRR